MRKRKIILDEGQIDEIIKTGDIQAIIDPLWWSVNIYDGEKKYYDTLNKFTLPQQYIFAIQWYIAEVCNGGHLQFFDNSTGIVYEEVLLAFAAIGANENEKILQEVIKRLGGNISKEREERWRLFDELKEVDLDDMDNAFYDTEKKLEKLMLQYIKKHKTDFYFKGVVKN